MTRYICELAWRLSEWSDIGLGCFAPYVFDKMISAEGIKGESCSHGHINWDDCPDCRH